MVRVDFNAWNLDRRMEHAARCSAELRAVGVFNDERGMHAHAAGRAHALRLASVIAQLVARRMQGSTMTLPTERAAHRLLAAPIRPSPAAMLDGFDAFVSSDLLMWVAPRSLRYGNDVTQVDADRPRVYRRLDLPYFGWLAKQMDAANAAAALRQISSTAIALANARFDAVLEFACTRWSVDQLQEAQRWSDCTYHPPLGSAA